MRGGSSLPAKEGGTDRASDSGRHPVGEAPRIRPEDGVLHLFEDGFPCGALHPPVAETVVPERAVLALVGPTASGKSDLAIRAAAVLPFPVEIVSCDAYQVYRGLDIGSGKPAPGDLRAAPHHLMDCLEPDDPCTAGRYQELAAAAVRDIHRRGAAPLIVGGSGLYFRALRDGVFPGGRPDHRLRARLAAIAERPRGDRWLTRLLVRLDPRADRRIHPNDRVRRLRALEVALGAGAPITRLQATRRPPLAGVNWRVAGLDPPRDLLVERIRRRVRAMFAAGLVEEARRLGERHQDRWPGRRAIGYREVLAALAGDPGPEALRERLPEVEARIAAATRRYAKRQLTWFRRERGVVWRRALADDPVAESSVLGQFRALAPAGVSRGGP